MSSYLLTRSGRSTEQRKKLRSWQPEKAPDSGKKNLEQARNCYGDVNRREGWGCFAKAWRCPEKSTGKQKQHTESHFMTRCHLTTPHQSAPTKRQVKISPARLGIWFGEKLKTKARNVSLVETFSVEISNIFHFRRATTCVSLALFPDLLFSCRLLCVFIYDTTSRNWTCCIVVITNRMYGWLLCILWEPVRNLYVNDKWPPW